MLLYKEKLHASLLFGLIGIIALFALWKVPASMSTPVYYHEAMELLEGGSVDFGFTQIGYTAFLYFLLKWGGLPAVYGAQMVLYVLTVGLVFLLVRIWGVSYWLQWVTCLAVALHPYMVFNIKRIVDNTLAVPCLLLFFLGSVLFQRFPLSKGIALAWGGVFGCSLLVRPNFLSLVPFVMLIFFLPIKKLANRNAWICFTLFLLSAFVMAVGSSTCWAGKPVVITRSGSYNLFAGANPYSRDALMQQYNMEYSILPALEKIEDPEMRNMHPYDIPSAKYRQWAYDYIRENPLDYIQLCLVKLFVLFRPDYRNIQISKASSSARLVRTFQTLMALPILVWLLLRSALMIKGVPTGWQVPWFLLAYISIFVITGADPRFRLSLDILLLTDCGRLSMLYKNISQT